VKRIAAAALPALMSLVVLAALIALARPLPAVAQPAATAHWRGIERVIAFADVHGAYAEFEALLRETGIVDERNRWAAGSAHVVSLGDLLDRGAGSRKVMDLLMSLQAEARAAGGQLHVVLGNHEAMNLLGDLRYVDPGEYAAYADLESAEERAERRKAWDAAQSGAPSAAPTAAGAAAPDPAFDRKFPPGYFGHRRAFAATGRYGQWLLSLPVAIAIDDTLFMHAGPSALLRGMSLAELNLRYRTALAEYMALADRLEAARLLQPGDDFHRRATLARERLSVLAAGGRSEAGLDAVITRFERADDEALLSNEGPNWHRGAAACPEATEADVLLPLLQQFGVTRLVIGHTPTRDRRAVSRFDGRVIKLDAGMNRAVYKGRAAALLLPGPQAAGAAPLLLRYAGEPGTVPLAPEPRFVAPKEVDEPSVLAALAEGELSITGPRAPNELNVAVEHAGRRIGAVFQVRSAAALRHELAAFRLDRQLGLGIVPATVEREVQGQRGVLQARPARWLSQAEVQRQQPRRTDWCGAGAQYQLVYAFDMLIGNERRTPESLFFDADAWFVHVTAHDRAFGRSLDLPAYLQARPPVPGAELRRRLATLNDANLAAALGDTVDERSRRAILQRRDALLALPAAAVEAKGR
jgi:hypothetical protein